MNIKNISAGKALLLVYGILILFAVMILGIRHMVPMGSHQSMAIGTILSYASNLPFLLTGIIIFFCEKVHGKQCIAFAILFLIIGLVVPILPGQIPFIAAGPYEVSLICYLHSIFLVLSGFYFTCFLKGKND